MSLLRALIAFFRDLFRPPTRAADFFAGSTLVPAGTLEPAGRHA